MLWMVRRFLGYQRKNNYAIQKVSIITNNKQSGGFFNINLPLAFFKFQYNPVPGLVGFSIGRGVYGAEPCGLLRLALKRD